MSVLQARTIASIREVDAAAWDACAQPADAARFDPFLSHAFLRALEDSRSASAKAGWAPQHILVEAPGGHLLGCAPAYLKGHSYGEYVFDHAWAHAYDQAGGRYYPKLQIAVPFTPVTGRRLLVRPEADEVAVGTALGQAMREIVERLGLSSAHITFPTRTEWERLGGIGFLQRTDQQFHWDNRGYATFDDFLADLSSRKRKQVRKERREAQASGVAIEVLTGGAIGESHWDAFYSFYQDTGSRKWGTPYLTRDFFSLIGDVMPERIVLILCRRGGRYIAGALNFLGGDTLYGRNWGCVEDHPFLHFEACYYQAIEFAIAHKLRRVEAGAQGTHKLARGYLPAETYSVHWFRDPGLQNAVARYLAQEREAVRQDIAILAEHSPFRLAGGGSGEDAGTDGASRDEAVDAG